MEANRRFDVVATVGFCCWVVVSGGVAAGVLSFDGPTTATLAVLLATFVVVPLAARLADLPSRTGERSRWYRAASVAALPSALAALASLALPTGALGTLLALPWLVVTLLFARFGLERGAPNAGRPPELALSVALLYLPVAGVALTLHRADFTVGFGATTVLLTVVHFHYAGCALSAFAGLLGRYAGGSTVYRILLGVVLVGPGLIGLGIAFSPAVELAAATVFGVVVAGVAGYALRVVPARAGVGEALVCIAAVAVTVSMAVVVGYLASRLTPATFVTFETMLRGHGWLNAVGFALVGLLGWRLLDPPAAGPPLGMPTSRVRSTGRVGADYLERAGLVADGTATGMVDDFDAFDGPAFGSAATAAAISAFYERTARYSLHVESRWERGFRLGGRLFGWFGRRVEQLNFPVEDHDPEQLSSRIVPVDDRADGRSDVRAWVRTYDGSGEAIYVALYATHRLGEQPYMNIAFPFPFSNLTSVLTVESLDGAGHGGVVLSTGGDPDGDAGIYLRTPVGPLRIPMDETIRVWTPDAEPAFPPGFGGDGGADLFARHEVTLLGRRFLRLDYRLTETPSAATTPNR